MKLSRQSTYIYPISEIVYPLFLCNSGRHFTLISKYDWKLVVLPQQLPFSWTIISFRVTVKHSFNFFKIPLVVSMSILQIYVKKIIRFVCQLWCINYNTHKKNQKNTHGNNNSECLKLEEKAYRSVKSIKTILSTLSEIYKHLQLLR